MLNQARIYICQHRMALLPLPLMGGEVLAELNAELVRGTADQVANGKVSRFVSYENELPSIGRFGLCLIILRNSASPRHDGPWFIRDNGMEWRCLVQRWQIP